MNDKENSMSAAARLRELHEQMTPPPWFCQVNDLIGGHCILDVDMPPSQVDFSKRGARFIGDFGAVDAEQIAAVRNALPEIAAVIEAAETVERQEAERETGIQAKWFTRREKALNDMRDSLAALSARLNGGE